MSFTSLCNRVVVASQLSNTVLDTTAVTLAMTLTRQPATSAKLTVEIFNGVNNTGTVDVVGLVAGVTTTETLTFTTAEIKLTTNVFTSIVGLCTTNLTNETPVPNICVKAFSKTGQPVVQYVVVNSTVSVAIRSPKHASFTKIPGIINNNELVMFSSPTALTVPSQLNMDTVIYDAAVGITYGLVSLPEAIYAHSEIHHYQTRVKPI